MVSPEDSSGSPGSHQSASLAGTEEAADLRVQAAVARERAQHVSCGATGLTFHARCMAVFTDPAGCRSHSTCSLQPHQSLRFRWQLWQCHMAAAGKVGLLTMPTTAECSSWLPA